MTNKVLIAIDSTGLADLVVDTLAAQLRPDQTQVLVLQVVEPLIYSVPPEMAPGYTPEMTTRRKEAQGLAKQALNNAVEILQKAGFKAESRLVESEIRDGIVQTASEWRADVIVVTSHAREGIAKFLHRSVAESVVHRAPCSVLVIKEPGQKAAA
jgi:nucleotide-binding universal stress UspA family protein